MPRRIFIDTAHLLAIFNPRDELHDRAFAVADDLAQDRSVAFITSVLAITEFLAAVARTGRKGRIEAFGMVESLRSESRARVLPLTEQLFEKRAQSLPRACR